MTGFTKHDCSAIRADMQAALADVYAKHGIDPDARITMRYGATLKITIEAARLVEGDNGVNVASKEATDWVSYCAPWNGYDPDAIGREVVMRGETWVFVGANWRASKYPLLFRKADGRVFKFGEAAAKQHLMKAEVSS